MAQKFKIRWAKNQCLSFKIFIMVPILHPPPLAARGERTPHPRYAPRTYHQISRQGMKFRNFLCPVPVKVLCLCMRNRDRGSGGTAPLILNLDTRWMCGHLHATVALPPRKHSLLSLNRRLGGFQSWSRCLGKTSAARNENTILEHKFRTFGRPGD